MSYADILVVAMGITAVMILAVSVLMLKVIKFYVKESVNPTPFATPEERARRRIAEQEVKALKQLKPSIFNRLMGLKPLSEEKDLVMEHEFDGITELDNPTPGWFMVLFYGSIIFAIVYMFNYEVLGWGPNQDEEYATELAEAEEAKIAYLSKPGNAKNAVNENNMEQSKDAAILTSGAGLFVNRCTPCHGELAQGLVGPNLTDEYWIHGGSPGGVFKTIKYGVPEKGMVAWEKSLSAQQISDLTNYILSLQGSSPAGAKAAEGEKLK